MTPTSEQFAALLDDFACVCATLGEEQSSPLPVDTRGTLTEQTQARTAVLDAYAQALDSAGQLRAERNDLQSKLNHMTDDRDSYAQARAGGAVKVPDERTADDYPYSYSNESAFRADEWNACRAEVLRLNHPPAEAATDEWKQAIDDALVTSLQCTTDAYTDPRKALSDLIAWHVAVATDPCVNGGYTLMPLERIELLHTLTAGECPPHSRVVLASAIKRLAALSGRKEG